MECQLPAKLHRALKSISRSCHGPDRMVVRFTYVQSVSITTDVVCSNLDHGKMYNIMW